MSNTRICGPRPAGRAKVAPSQERRPGALLFGMGVVVMGLNNTSKVSVLNCMTILGVLGLGACGGGETTTTDPMTTTSVQTTTAEPTTTEPDATTDTPTTGVDTEADTMVLTTGEPEEAVCGDGLISTGEECDNGTENGKDGLCTADCKEAVVECGDGILAGDEQCDDGAANGNDKACTLECTTNVCGDGFAGPGEDCDEGPANSDLGTCSTMCKKPACGDSVLNMGEECDAGSSNGDDKLCTSMCKNAKCGDGLVAPGEGCDDGNMVDDDACTNLCALGSCGDGVKQMGEDCDDKNMVDTDACLNNCVAASCGDGKVWEDPSESCDDGNADNTDACTTLCKAPSCDDGIKSGDEEDVDCGGDTCKSCYGMYQHRWKGAEVVQSGQWKKITGADADIVTRGGPLEIELSIPMVGGGDSACRPTIDGAWAGKPEGLPELATWHEGRERTGWNVDKGFRMWKRVRVYNNIPAGKHKLGVQCRTSSGAVTVGRAESTSLVITREYDGVKNKVYQKVALGGTNMGVSSAMVKIAGTDLTFDTAVSDIEVSISLSIGNGGHAGCLPWMDGAPMKSEEQAYGDAFWHAGLESTYGSWINWTHTRLYKNIPLGTHTFSIRCYNDSGTLNMAEADMASVLIVRELDNNNDKVWQGHKKYPDGGWKINGGIDSMWYNMAGHQAAVSVTNGALEVTEFLDIYNVGAGGNGWMTCRPVVDGAWLGVVSGLKFLSNEEEGVYRQNNNGHHGMWHRRRIYANIPNGDYVVSLQCLSNVSGYNASYYGQGTLLVRDVQLIGDI
jgi:cysteine-rich repeat protein